MINFRVSEIRTNRWIIWINDYSRGPVITNKEHADAIADWLRCGGYDNIIKSPIEDDGVDIDG